MEEQIDILNPDGTKTGRSCGRTKIHAEGLWHRTVHIWALDNSGRILFQLRSHLKENNPNLLDTSCAGHISAGDDSRNAGIRELSEELGRDVTAEEVAEENKISVKSVREAMKLTGDNIEGLSKGQTQ